MHKDDVQSVGSSANWEARGRRFSLAAGMIVLTLGGTVLAGWIFGIPALKSLRPDWVSMKANTALCFLLAGAGLALGLAIAWNINRIRVAVEWLTGEQVFDPSIYYFYRIPSIVDPFTVAWIIVGAVGIAVASSVLPALRAARLHPVEALRHD